jgi:serine protease Do
MTADGYILTNNHVVDDADSIRVRTGEGKSYLAKVIGADPKTDIAVIKIEATGLTPIPKGNSGDLRVGEMVMAIGSPLSGNLAHTVTSGIVSAVGRSNVGLADYEDFIQTDAAINPGNSGGALINLDGELVGINAAIASRSGGFEGIGFAVPINMASHVMQSLMASGKVVRGWMGVSIQSINEDVAKAMNLASTNGALVSDILKDSPAEKAGLESEDIIIKLNKQDIRNSTQLRNQIAETAPGTSVDLVVLRNNREVPITIKLGELPSDDELASAEGRTPELGFRVAPLDPELAARYDVNEDEGGVVVTAVDENSEAYENGLREGDVIRGVNRQPVQSLSDFNTKARGVRKGETILLRVLRGESGYFIAFTL